MKNFLSNKYRLLIINLFILTNYSFSQNWLSLTTHNVSDYFNSIGYNFDGKKNIREGGSIVYIGSKKTTDSQILFDEIAFENGIPYARAFTSSTKFNSAAYLGELSDNFFALSFFLDLKNDLIDEIGSSNFSILKSTDKLYETDWKKTNDIEVKHSIKIIEPKTTSGKYEVRYEKIERVFQQNMEIAGVNVKKIDAYNLEEFVTLFLRDLFFFSENYDSRYTKIPNKQFYNQNVSINFDVLDHPSSIALAYGKDIEGKVIVKVDADNWANSTISKKLYIIYHELGHDILNFEHGEGGKMMYCFAERDYSWDEFVRDKNNMFRIYFQKRSK